MPKKTRKGIDFAPKFMKMLKKKKRKKLRQMSINKHIIERKLNYAEKML